MSEIDIAGTGSIGQPSYLGGVSTTLPFDPKTARLPKELPEGRGNSETNRLPGLFIAQGIAKEVPGGAGAILRLFQLLHGTDTK